MEATRGLALRQTPCLALRTLFRVAFPDEVFGRASPASHFASQSSPLSASIGLILQCVFSTPSQCSSRTSSAVMPPPSLLRSWTRPNLYVCARCALVASQAPSKTTRRSIGLKYLTKVADAENQWKGKAARIRAGEEKSMLTILEERGLVQSITG
jgi:hypothetical protein